MKTITTNQTTHAVSLKTAVYIQRTAYIMGAVLLTASGYSSATTQSHVSAAPNSYLRVAPRTRSLAALHHGLSNSNAKQGIEGLVTRSMATLSVHIPESRRSLVKTPVIERSNPVRETIDSQIALSPRKPLPVQKRLATSASFVGVQRPANEAPRLAQSSTPTPTVSPAPVTTSPAPAIPATPTASGPARNAQGEPLVTNVFVDSELKQALADTSTQTGVTIVADSTVQGTVSVDLRDVPLEKALAIMLRSGGYSFIKVDDYYVVGAAEPTNPNFPLFSTTEIITLKHARPQDIINFLSLPYGRFLSAADSPAVNRARDTNDTSSAARRRISGFGNTGSSNNRSEGRDLAIGAPADNYKLVVTAPPHLMSRIKADIAKLDMARPQIMLEAYVLEISQSANKNFSLGFSTKYFSFNTAGGGINGGNTLSYSSVANTELAQINALTARGAARLRANPRVTTSDGQTAEMEVGRENYFSLLSGNVNFQYNTLEVIKSGILLRITPRILQEENEVMALVEPEVRDVTGQGPNGLPEITFRRAATNIRVRDGESIVIGGLVNEFTSKSKTKVPILGDIPLIGKAFRGENSQDVRTETVIIITPRIIRDDIVRDQVQSTVLKDEVALIRNGKDTAPLSPKLPPLDGKTLETKK